MHKKRLDLNEQLAWVKFCSAMRGGVAPRRSVLPGISVGVVIGALVVWKVLG